MGCAHARQLQSEETLPCSSAIVGHMRIRPSMEKEGACTQSWQPLMRDLGSLMSCAYISVGGYSGRQLSLSNTIFWFAYDVSLA